MNLRLRCLWETELRRLGWTVEERKAFLSARGFQSILDVPERRAQELIDELAAMQPSAE